MLVQQCPALDISKNQLYTDILRSPAPVFKILDALPFELVTAVVSFVTDIKDLRSLARASKVFQQLAEPGIYIDVVIRHGSHAERLASSIRSRPIRASWVRSVLNACHLDFFPGLLELAEIIPKMTKMEELVVETPDCNSISSECRAPWIKQQEIYQQLFARIPQPTTHMLPALRSCTLHFVDEASSLYSLGHHSVIFLHPTLTDLTISCASIDPPPQLHPLLLQHSVIKTTPLQSLNLVECDFDPQGLYHLLRLPQNLASLTITEAGNYVYYARDRKYSGLNISDILHPISVFQPNIRHLRIARLRYRLDALFGLPRLDLTPFNELKSVEFGNAQGLRHVTLQTPEYCALVHRAGPQLNTGAPNTSTLTYSDVSMLWWEPGIKFFDCAFKNKVSHGIEKLQTLILVLVDNELTMLQEGLPEIYLNRQKETRRTTLESTKRSIRLLGALGRTPEVGIRVIVDWVRPNGCTIPPYLTGEYVPETTREYDSAVVEG